MRLTDKRVVKYFDEEYEVLYGHCYIATDSDGNIFAYGEAPVYVHNTTGGSWHVRDGAGHGTPPQYIGMMDMLNDNFNPEFSLRKI